jgi:5-methylcytosine-specific restriction endonuclease McrA
MTIGHIATLTDIDLIAATARAAADERTSTVELIRLLMEVDTRKLYLSRGHSSLFRFCTRVLQLSEQAAYGRITAARAARRFPQLLTGLETGDLTLSSVGLLAPHLTEECADVLIDAVRSRSTREVEAMIANLYRQPGIPTTIRTISESRTCERVGPTVDTVLFTLQEGETDGSASDPPVKVGAPEHATEATVLPPPVTFASRVRPAVSPLGYKRYLLRVTIDEDAHRALERLRALLRHRLPSGDVAAIVSQALAVLLDQVERQKCAATSRPKESRSRRPSGRTIPAVVRRAVWARDAGRCAFVGKDGRCSEATLLEFHHVVPFADGGVATLDNIQLRCRAHNRYEHDQWSGPLWRDPEPVSGHTFPARRAELGWRS